MIKAKSFFSELLGGLTYTKMSYFLEVKTWGGSGEGISFGGIKVVNTIILEKKSLELLKTMF